MLFAKLNMGVVPGFRGADNRSRGRVG